MATTTGKKARKRGGNRFACKRAHRHSSVDKAFSNNVMSPAEYWRIKKGR